ncbi:hypothetical protein Q9292_00765 [Methylophilus sp. VKM B-3414]|uniref:hypothetical protein n=1 Tax=Methylophilus sp. VKM B-3414 TaxID=3076121 RepID=UPI0028C78AC7|nr:hypothetical protein [Methylophilus sp. VKM B-3414]MDT7848122.1 hypothetical protein [Methylophilus sp. VKM B-3414]
MRDSSRKDEKVEFHLGSDVVKRQLKVVTYHARDVYPELLRSTLLVRIVAAYEAFLVDCIEEVSTRSREPFLTDGRVDFSQEQLLSIDAQEGVYHHIVKKTLRRLTSGGLKELRKFYQKNLGIDLTSEPVTFGTIEEIHDRRHLFVHRSGYADGEYVAKHGSSWAVEDKLLPVPEAYLVSVLQTLESSGLHIKKSLETIYPAPPTRHYVSGDFLFPNEPEHLLFISFQVRNDQGRAGFSDLSLPLNERDTLKNIVAWASDDGQLMRMIVGGDSRSLVALRNILRERERNGSISAIESFKVKR